ncbi:JmjC domain-containing protein [Nocardioides dongxiaopingii]|uniref:JmjC domain-containing protein n=1 Tax=Nocardioides dongxiaopingii TaxID=2576036 RepID=UPI0010C76EEE|nr:cupin domain-containing protein [Nocardioides dongxiaopingii]
MTLSEETTALGLLLGGRSELDRCWEEEPFVVRGLPPFDDVCSLDDVNRLVFEEVHDRSFFRLFDGGVEQPATTAARRRERAPGDNATLLDPDETRRLVAAGHTLVLEEVRTLLPAVDAFTRALESELGHHCYCAAFLSPPDAVGAGAHWDVGSVFLRQLHGGKSWRLGRPVEPAIRRPWNRASVTFEDPVTFELGEGDCLYIPRGWIHEGHTQSKHALHLSIAVQATTWGDVLHAALDRSERSSPSLREALPPAWRMPSDQDAVTELGRRLAGVDLGGVCGPVDPVRRRAGSAAAPGISAWGTGS